MGSNEAVREAVMKWLINRSNKKLINVPIK